MVRLAAPPLRSVEPLPKLAASLKKALLEPDVHVNSDGKRPPPELQISGLECAKCIGVDAAHLMIVGQVCAEDRYRPASQSIRHRGVQYLGGRNLPVERVLGTEFRK